MEGPRDLELDADGPQCGNAPQAVRRSINLNLTKKSRMRTKSSSNKTSKSSRRDRKSERDGDGDMNDNKNFRRSSKSSYDKKKETDEDDREDEELDWSHTVMFIGDKVQDPMIHMCEKCLLPILIYGRLNPCKHVFCLSCAEMANRVCPRCEDTVERIEPAGIGQIFVCSYGGSRNGTSGCRRSYLSQRDLIAHIKHRHEKEGSNLPEAELIRQQGALRMPYFTATNAAAGVAAVPGGGAGGNILINTIPTSTHAGLQNTMVLQPAGSQQIFVDANRLSLLQQTGQVAQVQLQPLPQGMALAPQPPQQFQSSATAPATAFLTPPPPQQQFQAAGIAPQQQQGVPPAGRQPPGDPRLNPNQQMAGGMQNDWRSNPPPPQQPGEWAVQRSSSQQSFYK